MIATELLSSVPKSTAGGGIDDSSTSEVQYVRKFLLELGVGFALVGQQYHLEFGGQDFYIDLLFYHLKLRCFVVIELKATEFKPEFTGKLNFYLSAGDDRLRHADDKPSVGIVTGQRPAKEMGVVSGLPIRYYSKTRTSPPVYFLPPSTIALDENHHDRTILGAKFLTCLICGAPAHFVAPLRHRR